MPTSYTVSAGGQTGGFSTIGINFDGSSAVKASKQIQSVSKQTGILNSRLGAMAISAIGAYQAMNMLKQHVMDSTHSFREFEYSIAEVATLLTDLEEEIIPHLTAGVVGLSVKFGQTTTDLAGGLYDIISAAFPAEESLTLLNTAAKAAVAGLSDTKTAVDILTSIMNVYGMTANEAAILGDDLFMGIRRGKYVFKDLEQAVGYVVPIGAQAGLTFKEMQAAMMTATRHGLHLDMTARGLALAIQDIISPTAQARKNAAKYGISMNDVALKTKGLVGWIEELNEKTKEYGRTLITELFPNMRSQRVMSVLVSEEGIQGMVQDYDLLLHSLGRLDEAFGDVAETEKFAAKQMEQVGEVFKREIGEATSGPIRYLDLFKDSILSAVLAGLTGKDMLLDFLLPATVETGVAFVSVSGDIDLFQATIDSMNTQIRIWESNLIDVTTAVDNYKDEVIPAVEYTIDLLEATRDYNYAAHDIKVGMVGLNDLYLSQNSILTDAVDIVSDYTAAQKRNNEQMEILNLTLRENNIEIMKLQLRGMMRRRGLTRNEEKQVKRLQIANLQARIDYEENQEMMSVADYEKYISAKHTIDKEVALAWHRVFSLKDTYESDIAEWNTYLTLKLKEYSEFIAAMQSLNNRLTIGRARVVSMGGSTEPFPVKLPYTRRTIIDFMKELIQSRRGQQYQRGTHYIPKTGPAIVHKGEQIIPAGSNRNVGGGGRLNATININISEIRNYTDIEDLGSQIALAVKNNILSTDTSNYRMR